MSIDHGFLVESASVAISLPGYRAIYTRPILIRNRSPPSVGLPAQNPSPYFFARYWLTRARIATNSGMSSALASTSFNGIGRLLPFARSQVPILRYLGCHIPCRARSPTLIFRMASTPATATSGYRGRLAPPPPPPHPPFPNGGPSRHRGLGLSRAACALAHRLSPRRSCTHVLGGVPA